MKSDIHSAPGVWRHAAALLVLGAMLSGCQSNITKELSMTAAPPDEFLTIRKQPLIVPPNMDLRPPEPGAPPLASADPRALARAGVTGSGPATTATTAGEQAILARAGAGEGDTNIRRRLLKDRGIESKDTSLANKLLVQKRTADETLDAQSEAQRLQQRYGSTGPAADNGSLLDSILGGSATN